MFGKYFKIFLISIFLFEIVSLIGYYFPIINLIGFFSIIAISIILSFKKYEYGLYILLAELFVGGKGYLFSFEYGDIAISIRIALFLILFSFWISKILFKKNISIRRQHSYWLLLILFIFWGIINGFLNNNNFSNIFFDANGWLFIFLIFPASDIIKSKKEVKNILQILFSAIFLISIKSLVSLFIFTNYGMEKTQWAFGFYRWIRETGVGEITLMGDDFYRIFFQSQIWALIGIFILLSSFFLENKLIKKKNIFLYFLLSILFSTIIISFSRSFWVGGLGGLFIFFILIFYSKRKIKEISYFVKRIIFVIFAGLFLIYLISPNYINLIGDRVEVKKEVAASSRWNLLTPLWSEVKNNWLLGAGFGKTVTYKTEDPRFLEKNPDGLNTTYAFEWGYLDIWLKMGIGGLVVYLTLLGKIFYQGIKDIKKNIIYIGFLSGLFALCITNVFSPYLNHPLGIGYIVLLGACMNLDTECPADT